MAEGEVISTVLDHKLSGDELLDEIEEFHVVELGKRAQEVEIESTPDHGGQREDVASLSAKSVFQNLSDAERAVFGVGELRTRLDIQLLAKHAGAGSTKVLKQALRLPRV